MKLKINIPGFTEEHQRAFQIFHPYAFRKVVDALAQGTRFVHYTSADAAMGVFQYQEVWMRKSSCMNDFMEIEHGFECLNAAYKNLHGIFKDTLDGMFPGFCGKLEAKFNGWLPHFRADTYIACISEHNDDEDTVGRLSMWRAYGGATGVAIVMNGSPFLSSSDALKVYTSPVAYLNKNDFEKEFGTLLLEISNNRDWLITQGEDFIFNRIFETFRFAILCTKHPGFHEEKEWRIIYTPTYNRSDRLIPDIQSIRGAPQPICKIPLKDIPEEELMGIEIPNFVDRVIIGPTQYPMAIREAFVTLLKEAGMQDAPNRVFVSDIPLRQ